METSIKRVRDHVPRPHQSHQQLENGPPHTKNLTSPRTRLGGSVKSICETVTIEVIDLNKLDLKSQFELVVGSDVIHHLADPIFALSNLLAATSTGGSALILESNPYNPVNIWRIIGHEHEVRGILSTPKNLSKWFIEAGWNEVKILRVPSFTPAGPKFLGFVLDFIDAIFSQIPILNRICAMHLVIATK